MRSDKNAQEGFCILVHLHRIMGLHVSDERQMVPLSTHNRPVVHIQQCSAIQVRSWKLHHPSECRSHMAMQRATMGQVCFTAIRSDCACLHGLHCSQFSVPECVLCALYPKVQRLGLEARTLPPCSTVPSPLSPVEPVVMQTLGWAHALQALPIGCSGRACKG